MNQIVPALWFADDNCEEAVNYYVSVFPDSKILSIQYFTKETEALSEYYKGRSGKVITAEFVLSGHKFTALDGGPVFRFSEAISFAIECADQSEIDYYWEKLSHVPESENCGWVKDRFGLSWQIVPYNMMELQQSDAQIQAVLAMKKIIIADLERLK